MRHQAQMRFDAEHDSPQAQRAGKAASAASVPAAPAFATAALVSAATAFFFLAVAILLTIVDLCCFDLSFFQKEYAENETAQKIGMSEDDLLVSTGALLDYLKGKRDDIVVVVPVKGEEREVFDTRETLHMVDVRDLYQNALALRNTLLVLAAALLVVCVLLSRRAQSGLRKTLQKGYAIGMAVMLLIIAIISLFAAVDFTAFWNSFHELLFDNDLWQLNPRVSIMINMFPATFFSHLVRRVILWSMVSFGAIALALFFKSPKSERCCCG